MKKLTLLIVLTLLSACNPTKSSVKSNVNGTSATISGVQLGTQCNSNTVGMTSSQYGTIYDQSMSMNFEGQVKAFLSATLSPNEVGYISSGQADPTGVRFSGRVKLDPNGNVIGNQSKVLISVYDDKVISAGQKEIQIDFDSNRTNDPAVITGQFNTSTGVGYLSLRDSYGEVRFEGTIDAQRFSGTAKFQNTTNVTGGTAASGNLGQFYIQRCSFLQ